jgi:uncharacterized protein (DUF2141 family)
MKKVLTNLMILAAAALSTSCWPTEQNWSLCPENNLVLKFRVQNVPNSQFDDYIDRVDIYLFDEAQKYLFSRRVETSDADGGRSVSFTLQPGRYHVVCWGNVNGNSKMCDLDKGSNFENSFVEIASPETGDPVYYTPYKASRVFTPDRGLYDIYSVEVVPGERTVRELVFVKVHRKVELFISGLEPATEDGGRGPVIEQTLAAGRFDFLLRRQCDGITLSRHAATRQVDGKEMFTTYILSKLTPIDDRERINIYNPRTGELAATINLAEWVERNGIADDSYIPIHAVFDMNAAVSISMPAWLVNTIKWN